MPRISVVIPVYNCEKWLAQTLDSLLEQTFDDFEVISVNDGSTDDSQAILNAYEQKDRRFRTISRPNTGIVGALNDGLAVAGGAYIARIDGDDLCHPDRFERQVAFLDAEPEVVAVGTWADLIDEVGRALGVFTVPSEHGEIESRHLVGDSAIHHPAVMMRAEAVRAVGGYREGFCPTEDYDLWLRLGEIGMLANLAWPGIIKRQMLSGLVGASLARRDATATQALADAWSRRELPGEPPEIGSGFKSHVDILAQWTWMALKAGHVSTARYYAWRYVLASPSRGNAWRALACAFRGR